MFKQRLLTTLVLIPLVLLAIYFAYPWLLGFVLLALVVAGGWEWLPLMPVKSIWIKLFFIFGLVGMVGASFWWLHDWLYVGLFAWFLILIAVVTFPASKAYWGFPIVVAGACLLLLPLFAASLSAIYLLPNGQDLIVYLLCLVWAADVGAYLIGKAFGKRKLIPQVSPGKTIEGVMGGVFLSLVVGAVAYFYFKPMNPGAWFLLAGFTALISVLGDLFISILKRRCQLKDTGHIFPGHGGVLDRLDSLIAAAPFFFWGVQVLTTGF
ncbi:phosphatidate cytidylyltransferase [Legionella impletisoli]|uniref:Phosphatidate cytidylyltransferase n=1 Tax=Legionella impletisoli TaxID=343510 RepID=A0A917ND72_9GAMM|nr:phosphatidate cytidylyltransferase [Legionella impletisoli]GGI89732.1 phosphatidate cytidylyltransferase [Legionella impletisoli]